MKKYAFVTCLTNEKYLPGLFVLNESLKNVESKHGLYVLIPDYNSFLSDIVSEKIPGVTVLQCPGIPHFPELSECNHYWLETFFKLRALSLVQFEKIILIDSDMLVLKNIDHLFECDPLSAVVAGEICYPEYKDLNSGLVVIQPSETMAQEYIECIPTVYALRKQQGLFCGDQDVFHYLNKDWVDMKHLKLQEGYNEFFYCCDEFVKKTPNGLKDLYIVHFIGPVKPWNCSPIKMIASCLKRLKFLELRITIKYFLILRKYKKH